MTDSEEKKEIIVNAPSKTVFTPEKKAELTSEKALEEERFGVLEFPKRINKYLGLTVIATGIWLLFIFTYITMTNQTNGIFLSIENSSLSIFIWSFVGLINLIVGLLFLGRE